MRPFATLLLGLTLAACHRAPAAAPAPAPTRAAAATVARAHGDEHNDHDGRAQAAPAADLQVIVNGKPAASWTLARLNATERVALTNSNGEARDGWPLRDLTRALVGEKARVVALASDDERVEIAGSDWQNASRTLLLRLSHRGEYKAQWLAPDGSSDDAFLKHIRRIEIAN